MLKLLAVALLALAVPAWTAPDPALTPAQAEALTGVWVLESGDRLYGVDYDKLLMDAAANGTIDGKALLEQALDARPGPTIKLIIPAVDEQSGAFVAYRVPVKADPHIPPLIRVVGIASADGTGPNATIVWKGIESDEAGSDEAIVKGDTMQFLHFDPQDVFNGTDVVNPSGLMTRVLKKDGSADVETELQAVAALLPLLPLAESGGNLAESDGAAPQGTAVTPSSAGFATAPHWMVALLAGAALAAAQLA